MAAAGAAPLLLPAHRHWLGEPRSNALSCLPVEAGRASGRQGDVCMARSKNKQKRERHLHKLRRKRRLKRKKLEKQDQD